MKKATANAALKLALEALELVSIEFVCNGAHHAKKDRHDWSEPCPIVERYQAAITAIKEALAQPEQEPGLICHKHDEPKRGCAWCDKHPPKRPWVKLTDDEVEDCMEMSIQKTCRAVEAKLKEKNT